MKILKELLDEKTNELPLVEKVYGELLKDILTGKITKGSRLTESKVCKLYEASRTPVREAFRRLEMDGIIETVPNKGAIVKGFSQQEVRDMLHLRNDCEVTCVKWAINRITESEEEELTDIFKYMEFYTKKNDIPKMIKINTAFHRIIYGAAHNKLLENTLISYQKYTDLCCPSNYFAPRYLEKVLEEHKKIYMAFTTKDVEAGTLAMRIHMDNSYKRRI